MTIVFEHIDRDGDRVAVDGMTEPLSGGESVGVISHGRTGRTAVATYLDAPAVDRLRAALAPYGTRREAPAETGNPAAILDYVDPDGDGLTVYTRTNPGEPVVITLNAESVSEVSVNLLPEAVTRLRAVLKPFDPAEVGPQPVAVEVGREYRLLPGSKYTDGGTTTLHTEGTTRVRVTEGPDSDGDVAVTPLAGRMGGRPYATRYVDPQYLAPLDDDPATLATPEAVEALSARLAEVDLVDPRRVAALRLARELAPTAVPGDLLVLAAFLVAGLTGVAELAQSAATAGAAQ